MNRDVGIGELTGRLDDLESQVEGLRRAIIVGVILGVLSALPWLDNRKEARRVDKG